MLRLYGGRLGCIPFCNRDCGYLYPETYIRNIYTSKKDNKSPRSYTTLLTRAANLCQHKDITLLVTAVGTRGGGGLCYLSVANTDLTYCLV